MLFIKLCSNTHFTSKSAFSYFAVLQPVLACLSWTRKRSQAVYIYEALTERCNLRCEFLLECKLIEKTNNAKQQQYNHLQTPGVPFCASCPTHFQCAPSFVKCNSHFVGDSQAQHGSCQLWEASRQWGFMGIWLMFYLWKVWEDVLYNSTSVWPMLPSTCNVKFNRWCGNTADQSFQSFLVWLVYFFIQISCGGCLHVKLC